MSGFPNVALSFDGTRSSDPDGTIVGYAWEFGDGATATGAMPSHSFTSTGTYVVNLTVTDELGATGTDSLTAYICSDLQVMIDAALPGDTVTIPACTYTQALTISKALTLQGGSGVLFDGRLGQPTNRAGPALTITSSNVTITGYNAQNWTNTISIAYAVDGPVTITNSVLRDAGRAVSIDGCCGTPSVDLTLTNDLLTQLSGCYGQLLQAYGARTTALVGNTILGYGCDASNIGGSHSLIQNNTITRGLSVSTTTMDVSDNTFDSPNNGVYFTSNGGLSHIYDNTFTRNVGFNGNFSIHDNTFQNSYNRVALTAPTAGALTFERNNVTGNPEGYVEVYGQNTTIRYNTFNVAGGCCGSPLAISLVSNSQLNLIYLNNIVGGSIRDDGVNNRFDTGSVGNYWSLYTGNDTNGNGIGDTPFNLAGSAGSLDRFPIVAASGWTGMGNLAPIALTGAAAFGTPGTVLSLDGMRSQDPDGSIASYAWDLGDGNASMLAAPTHAYNTAGVYTIQLTVTDDQGASGTTTQLAYVCPALQVMIDAALPGDTVTIPACTYTQALTISKALTLQGGSGVLFDGRLGQPTNRAGPALTITSSNVTITGYNAQNWTNTISIAYAVDGPVTITNSVLRDAGRAVSIDGCCGTPSVDLTLTNDLLTQLSGCYGQLLQAYGARTTALVGNTILGYGCDASNIGGSHSLIQNNTITRGLSVSTTTMDVSDNTFDSPNNGVYFTSNGGLSHIYDNTFTRNVGFNGNFSIHDNTFQNSYNRVALTAPTAGALTFERNNVTGNPEGYVEVYGQNTTIRYNTFNVAGGCCGSPLAISLVSNSQLNLIYLNNIVGGSIRDDGVNNRFDTGSVGNYWSLYTGNDTNGNGIGDTPFNLAGSAGSLDRFPIVAASGWTGMGNLAPIALTGAAAFGTPGTVLSLDGMRSQDPDGSIASYAWDLGDGNASMLAAPTHAYNTAGVYTIQLTVTDDQGASGTTTQLAYVCPALQVMIDAALPGDTVTIPACTYTQALTISKALTLQGGSGVLFDGRLGQPTNRAGPALTITSSNVTITGYNAQNWTNTISIAYAVDGPVTITNSVLRDAGRAVSIDGCCGTPSVDLTLTNDLLTQLSGCYGQLLQAYGARTTALVGNTILGYGCDASNIGGSHSLIQNNTITRGLSVSTTTMDVSDNTFDSPNNGVYFTSNGGLSHIYDNTFTRNVGFNGNFSIHDNTFQNSYNRVALTAPTAGALTFERNNVTGNPEGYVEVYGQNTTIRYNTFNVAGGCCGSPLAISLVSNSQLNLIYLNNIVGGSIRDDGVNNRFDTGSVGNYWSLYTGNDTNGNGIGDTPFNLAGSAGSLDRFPLMTSIGQAAPPQSGPAITGLAPARGIAGSQGTLSGTGLTGVTSVRFGTFPSGGFTVVDNTTIGFTVPGIAPGVYTVTISSAEGNSTWCCFEVDPTPRPDLIVSSVEVRAYEGYNTLINATNVGNGDSALVAELVFIDNGERVSIGGIGPLAAGATGSSLHSWIPTPGWHTLQFAIDWNNQINESNETNNVFEFQYFVVGPEPPTDYHLPDLTSSPEAGIDVDAGSVIVHPTNGTLWSGQSYDLTFFNATPPPNAGYGYGGGESFGAELVNPNGTVVSTQLAYPGAPGKFNATYPAVLLCGGQWTMRKEGDGTIFSQFQVSGQPCGSPPPPPPPPPQPCFGGNGSISGIVRFNGTPTDPVRARVWNSHCEQDFVVAGDFVAGVPFSFTTMATDEPWTVDAFFDPRGIRMVDEGEWAVQRFNVNASDNLTDVVLDLSPGAGGGYRPCSFGVAPDCLPTPGPNPSGPSATVRVVEASGEYARILYPGDITVNVTYDLTFTNITQGASEYGSSANMSGLGVFDPDGQLVGNTSSLSTDLEHGGKFNVTFPSYVFPHASPWTLRDGDWNVVTRFWVTPGTPPSPPSASVIFRANLTATAPGGSSDFATFGAAQNATSGFDAGLDSPAPPAPPSGAYAQLYFSYPLNAGDAQRLHATYVAPADEITYNASAVIDSPPGSVTLGWNQTEISTINASYAVQLIDGPTVVNMRTQANYSYPKAENGLGMHNITIRLIAGADLEISADVLVVTPTVRLNASVDVSGQVSNTGSRTATQVQANLFIDDVLVAVNTSFAGSIAPGGTASFSFPPQSQQVVGSHTVRVTVGTPDTEVTLVNNEASTTFEVVRYAVSLRPLSSLDQNASLGGTAAYAFEVANLGSVADNITFNLTGAPLGWNVSSPPMGSFPFAAGATANGTIVVSAPTSLAGLTDTLAVMSLTVRSTNDPSSSETQTMRTTLVMNQSFDLHTGWNLVALSVVPPDNSTAALFGPNVDRAALYTWDGVSYVQATRLDIGRGYWVLALAPQNDTFTGVPVLSAPLNLAQGWNLIGGSALSTAAPAAFGPDVVTYDGTRYVYGSTIDPGHGYWAHLDSLESAPTSLGMSLAPPRLSLESTSSSGPELTLPIMVSVGSVTDFVIIGSTPGTTMGYDAGFDSYQAPVPAGGAYAQFGVAQAGRGGALFHRALQSPSTTRTWALKASTTANDALATISWSPLDLANIDPAYRVELVDGARHINMRTIGTYAYASTPGLTRELQVIVTPINQGPTCLVALDGKCLVKSPASIGSLLDFLP